MTRTFISGITGFIGQALAQALKRSGHEVCGVARNPAAVEGCKVLSGDILALDAYAEAACQADVVIHLAAPAVASYIAQHPFEAMTVNVGGTLNILNCFQEGQGKRFLFLSTGKVYGQSNILPLREDGALNPAGVLGKSKLAAESMVQFFANHSSKQFTILRLFNGYGPGQKGDFLLPTILNQISKGSITLGDIDGKRDFIYIDDIVEAVETVIARDEHGKTCGIYNIGSGNSYSPADLVHLLEQIVGAKFGIAIDPSRQRKGEPGEERADISRLKALGWRPRTDMKAGLERTWRSLLHAANR